MLCPARDQTAAMVDNAMTGVVAVILGVAQYFADQPGIFAAADEAGNLSVGGDFAFGNFFNDR